MTPTRLIAAFLSALLLLPGLASAAEPPEAPEASIDLEQERLIAPSVIAQSEFAFHLANALGVRLPDNDDPLRAIRELIAFGIAPRAGWEPEAAVTPETIAVLRGAVATAASAGRLRLDPPDAVAAFEQIVAQLDLPLPAEPPRYAQDAVKRYEGECPDPSAYGYYYGDTGVPPYTYCPPPPAYLPMYAWVPSPFYWDGYFFTGFYTLRYPYVIVRPRPVRPPRFSEDILGGDRPVIPAPAPPPTGEGPGFRDTPIVRHRRPPSRAIPLPDRGPRFSEGILGGRRDSVPRTVPSVPPASSPRVAPAPRPPVRSAPRPSPAPPAARPAPPPSPAPAPSPGDRGWRDVIGQ